MIHRCIDRIRVLRFCTKDTHLSVFTIREPISMCACLCDTPPHNIHGTIFCWKWSEGSRLRGTLERDLLPLGVRVSLLGGGLCTGTQSPGELRTLGIEVIPDLLWQPTEAAQDGLLWQPEQVRWEVARFLCLGHPLGCDVLQGLASDNTMKCTRHERKFS